ncbi:MAG: isopentenyl transferase family protein, partial [Armatimonadota bacterium]
MLLQPRECDAQSLVILSAAKDLASNPTCGHGEVLRCAQDDKDSGGRGKGQGGGPIPLLVIAGPTATGKTEAAIRVAEAVGAEIVSADSMQIYRELEAGTAKPTLEE